MKQPLDDKAIFRVCARRKLRARRKVSLSTSILTRAVASIEKPKKLIEEGIVKKCLTMRERDERKYGAKLLS